MAAAALPSCQSCATGDAIVLCLLCGAGLCLLCDHALHAAGAALHPRAPLCDACHAAPAALRYHDAGLTLCAACSRVVVPPAGRDRITSVVQYTGCPAPADLLRLISTEAPQPPDEFQVWLADKLLLLDDRQLTGEQVWDVAEETAKLEKMLQECASTPPISHHLPQPRHSSSNSDAGLYTMPMASLTTEGADSHKKNAERERAKLRYNEKKKKRRFCKQIMYASRKARADTRKRVQGRFAKASSTCHDPGNEIAPIQDDPSTDHKSTLLSN